MENKTYDQMVQKVIQANIDYHSNMAKTYDSTQPHFLPENQKKVELNISNLAKKLNASKLLDLGCGTGFMINIAKKYVKKIQGVDITQAMLDKIDRSGPAKIETLKHDTGSAPIKEGHFDIVTSYSFLHHIYDIVPTLKTAYKGLRPGGVFYSDLEPNFYFWEEINKLDPKEDYDPIVKREIQAVSHVDEEVKKMYGISPDVINDAEYGKTVNGGFKENDLKAELKKIGFQKVDIFYHWFVGEGFLINDKKLKEKDRFDYAEMIHAILSKGLPLSRGLFKYMGFFATK